MEMIEVFSSISAWIGISLVISVIGLFALTLGVLVKSVVSKKLYLGRFTKFFGALFIALIVISLSAANVMKRMVLAEAESILASPKSEVRINGQLLDQKASFTKDFLDRKTVKQSGSAPEEAIDIKISDGSRELDLTFKRDSRNENLYWVYYPEYKFFASLTFVETQLIEGRGV